MKVWVAWVHPYGEDNESTWVVAGNTKRNMFRQLVLEWREFNEDVDDEELAKFSFREWRQENDIHWNEIPLAGT